MTEQSPITNITFNGKTKEYKFKPNEKFISYAWIADQAGFDWNDNLKVTWSTDVNSGCLNSDECLPIVNNMTINIIKDK